MSQIPDSPLKQLIQILVCPLCHLELTNLDDALECHSCQKRYPIVDGIAVLSTTSGASTLPEDEPKTDRETLSKLRRERNAMESGRHIRRNRDELHILTDMLSRLPTSGTLLNVACRGGQFSGPIQSATRLLIESDRNLATVRHAVQNPMNPPRVAGLSCDADALPFVDGGVDGIVCIRLSHHLESDTVRERVLHELLRVAATFVIFSFSDVTSLPNLSRAIRFKPKNPGGMSLQSIEVIARMHDTRVKQIATVSPLGSRHRYVTLEKYP